VPSASAPDQPGHNTPNLLNGIAADARAALSSATAASTAYPLIQITINVDAKLGLKR
jgi:hypothetical protein